MQVAFCTKCGIAAIGNIRFGVEHEADGTFAVGFGETRVCTLESCGELTVGDETTDLFGIPFAGWIETTAVDVVNWYLREDDNRHRGQLVLKHTSPII